MKKVLVVGSGGREHALVWKLSKSAGVERIYCAPGNAGIASLAECVDVVAEDVEGLLRFAKTEGIDFTVVGPEAPLCAGIVDRFVEEGLRIFGPTKAAAEIEGNKSFAKELMLRYHIPTAQYRSFTSSRDATTYLEALEHFPVVVKASGLAAGKGVVICDTLEDAVACVKEMIDGGRFGEAGSEVVIEEFLKGEEASILALTDGSTIAVLESSQDHKAAFDGDQGPNTGGMGAYSPAPVVTPRVLQTVESEVLVPFVHGMSREGRPYRGVIYAGLMMTPSGPRVLEFNARFGDPECQALLMRLDCDFLALLEACVDGTLEDADLGWDPRPALCVVLASGGYPGTYESRKPIRGLDTVAEDDDLQVFHAGTTREGDTVFTAGGRVLGVTALGDTLAAARDHAYAAVDEISFERVHARRDIGHRAIPADAPRT